MAISLTRALVSFLYYLYVSTEILVSLVKKQMNVYIGVWCFTVLFDILFKRKTKCLKLPSKHNNSVYHLYTVFVFYTQQKCKNFRQCCVLTVTIRHFVLLLISNTICCPWVQWYTVWWRSSYESSCYYRADRSLFRVSVLHEVRKESLVMRTYLSKCLCMTACQWANHVAYF
jgi:hypothetical protein